MCMCCGNIQPTSWRKVLYKGELERVCNACGLYYKKHGHLKRITNSPPPKPTAPRKPRRPKAPGASKAMEGCGEGSDNIETGVLCSSPGGVREDEPMSEIDHPLLTEGICLPAMGILRGIDEDKENEEPDDDDEEDDEDDMERLFSDILV
jgi:GATA zinc finger